MLLFGFNAGQNGLDTHDKTFFICHFSYIRGILSMLPIHAQFSQKYNQKKYA